MNLQEAIEHASNALREKIEQIEKAGCDFCMSNESDFKEVLKRDEWDWLEITELQEAIKTLKKVHEEENYEREY